MISIPIFASDILSVAQLHRRVLAEWFSVGLLQLHRITWQTSSGSLLEKVQRSSTLQRSVCMHELD